MLKVALFPLYMVIVSIISAVDIFGKLFLIIVAGKKCKISLEYGQKLHQKCEFFTNFQNFFEEKDQNIHLNDEFPLKIADISLQNRNVPGMRLTNSAFLFHAWFSKLGPS